MNGQLHAFQRRDWFTCFDCGCSELRDGTLFCTIRGRPIRWDPKGFGCSAYVAGDGRRVMVPTLHHYQSKRLKTTSEGM